MNLSILVENSTLFRDAHLAARKRYERRLEYFPSYPANPFRDLAVDTGVAAVTLRLAGLKWPTALVFGVQVSAGLFAYYQHMQKKQHQHWIAADEWDTVHRVAKTVANGHEYRNVATYASHLFETSPVLKTSDLISVLDRK